MLGLSAAEQAARQRAEASGKGLRRCIFLLLTGGPSHLETFDPKPGAPVEFRGPFRAISTAVPGVQLSETLPLLAQRLDKVALLRSLYHDATPIHETGQQLLQTGRLSRGGIEYPSLGSIVSYLLGRRNNLPAYAVLPAPLGDTGVSMWQGQLAGGLGETYNPWQPSLNPPAPLSSRSTVEEEAAKMLRWQDEPEHCRRAYGDSRFGRSCLLARRLVEQGLRFVTVNMFETLANQVTWDCHANRHYAPANLLDYRDTLCPDFDRALAALLDDLEQRGLLEETLVVATGEFGRTPRINDGGGRDHWPSVWSAVVAGGGVSGGQVIGASDARGTAPVDRPIEASALAATILQALGIENGSLLRTQSGEEFPAMPGEAIRELLSLS